MKTEKPPLVFFRPDLSTEYDIPFFDQPVQAGFPSPADDHLEERLDLNKKLIKHPSATFFVRVEGESMRDAGIFKDDILIVDRSIDPIDGKIVIALINGEFTVKKIRIKGKQIFLQAENPLFPLIEIAPEWDFQIWGVVTYIIHKAT